MKKLVVGILAHVDAGKTTLAEGMLYLTGSIRKLGRVDHKDAFLDNFELERARGITIFSKQAVFSYKDLEVSLLDTPGHVDFSAEMERSLQVLDYAILVISGSDGIQGHTQTLWKLLARYRIPTFLFVNKMDLKGTDRRALMAELKKRLYDGCVDFSEDQSPEEFMENIAMCDETLLNQYLEGQTIVTKDIAALIAKRKIYPCYFGSALKLQGVEALLDGLTQYTKYIKYPEEFGAKIYKIARDDQGNRLTYMKITGGSLKVKTLLTNRSLNEKAIENRNNDHLYQPDNDDNWEEKVDQIRIYSGARYETAEEAGPGTICAVTGLTSTYPGEGLGTETSSDKPYLEPVLNYQLLLPSDCDAFDMLSKLQQLKEEDPLLHITWSGRLKEIHVQLMGEVQVEILKRLILERFGINVEFGPGNILYKETIKEPVEGVGHFEPLRHYAEVHLKLEPDQPGSGLTFTSSLSTDLLDLNWQRLILTHLEEKEHMGVLTGSPITDMKITLIAGRVHLKHTEGGDFRQATYRAVRQGLKKAKSVLLEPYYDYRLEIPSESVGRAMSDIQRMSGSFNPPEADGAVSVLTGFAPVAEMQGYQSEVTAYTRGRGRLFCQLSGYRPCHNSEEVINTAGYDSESDLDNPTGSVFCSHGTGFIVEWDKVEDYMHLDSGWQLPEEEKTNEQGTSKQQDTSKQQSLLNKQGQPPETIEVKVQGKTEELKGTKGQVSTVKSDTDYSTSLQEDKELEAIYTRTYGPIKQNHRSSQNVFGYEKKSASENIQINKKAVLKKPEPADEYLLVDGYNIIFSWEELNELAKENLDAARNKLMDILCNYQGFKKCILILVFDAYKVKGGVGEVLDYHNIHVVYTKEAETADMYIEKVTHKIAGEHPVAVATSDALEQLIIMGRGAIRMSANELKEEIIRIGDQIRRDYLNRQPTARNYLKEHMDSILECFSEENDTDFSN